MLNPGDPVGRGGVLNDGNETGVRRLNGEVDSSQDVERPPPNGAGNIPGKAPAPIEGGNPKPAPPKDGMSNPGKKPSRPIPKTDKPALRLPPNPVEVRERLAFSTADARELNEPPNCSIRFGTKRPSGELNRKQR